MPDLLGRDAEELLRLPIDDLALVVLSDLVASYGVGHSLCWNNVRLTYANRSVQAGLDLAQQLEFLLRSATAWQWLRNESLLAPSIDQDPAAGWEVLTPLVRGAQNGGLVDARSLRSLRHAELCAALTANVLPIFSQGLYAAAVFQAMLEVEARVREGSGLQLDGVPLMKEAFKPGGPLADSANLRGDQEAEMALFWGAIGVFRNTAGHNRSLPDGDSEEAAEAIFLANALLRIVERRVAARNVSGKERVEG